MRRRIPARAFLSEERGTFERLNNYIKSNPLDFETTFEARAGGDELYRGSVHFLLRQPNQLRAEASFGEATYLVISDGTVMTIYNPQQRKFSQTAAPASLAAAFRILHRRNRCQLTGAEFSQRRG